LKTLSGILITVRTKDLRSRAGIEMPAQIMFFNTLTSSHVYHLFMQQLEEILDIEIKEG
jgi:hypothetical protein